MAIRVSWGHGTLTAPFERATVVSYRLSIVTIALAVRSQFAIVSDAELSTGVGYFGPKISGCSPWSMKTPWCY